MGRGVVGGSIRGNLKSVSGPGRGGEVVKKHVSVGLVCNDRLYFPVKINF